MSHVTPEKLRSLIAHCTGTDHWYQHGLCKGWLYTDGIKMVADTAEAYWLIDVLVTQSVEMAKRYPDALLVWKLEVKNDSAVLYCDPADDVRLEVQRIEFTDFPEGEWKFYAQNNTVFLPSEY